MICEGAMFDWSGVYFSKIIHPPKELVAAGYTAFMCTMASGRFVADWFATRNGLKKILQVSGILTATGLTIAVVFPYFITAMIGFLLVGAGVSSVIPFVYGLAGKSKILSPRCCAGSSFYNRLFWFFVWSALHRFYCANKQPQGFPWINCYFGYRYNGHIQPNQN